MLRTVIQLMGILTLAFLLVILGSLLIFVVIVPMPNLPGRFGIILTGISKAVLSTLVVVGWVYLLKAVTGIYVRKIR
ncbi:MAG: hypothetical protein V3R13_05815 [Nitrososphaerales archaeon]